MSKGKKKETWDKKREREGDAMVCWIRNGGFGNCFSLSQFLSVSNLKTVGHNIILDRERTGECYKVNPHLSQK